MNSSRYRMEKRTGRKDDRLKDRDPGRVNAVDKAYAGLDANEQPRCSGVAGWYRALSGSITQCYPGGVETLGTSLGLEFDSLPFLQAFET